MARRVAARLAGLWHVVAIFFIVGLWLVWAAQVRHGYAQMWRLFVVTAAILIVARLLAVVLLGLLDRLFGIGRDPGATPAVASTIRRGGRDSTTSCCGGALTALLWVAALLALVQAWGLRLWTWFHRNALGGQLASAAATILVARPGLPAGLGSVQRRAEDPQSRPPEAGRPGSPRRPGCTHADADPAQAFCWALLAAIFALTVLSEIGVNVAPLLAGARHPRRRHRFGSQKLVQGFHHRHFPAAGEHHAGRRQRDARRPFRHR
ncbi:MAG: hypothetical protein WDN04_00615 [Rhodospirillales bacterium]